VALTVDGVEVDGRRGAATAARDERVVVEVVLG